MTQTQNLSSLLVLAQDENLNDAEQHESAGERSARRRAVERFIYRELDQIETRIAQLEETEAKARSKGQTLQFYMAELSTTLEQLESERQQIIANDEQCVRRITELNHQAQLFEVGISQRRTLLTQYDADLARLDLRLQGMRIDHAHPQKDNCQFCHSPIDAPEPTAKEIGAHEREIARIRRLLAGASTDLEALIAAYGDNAENQTAELQRHSNNMTTLKRELEPARTAIQSHLYYLAEAEKIRAERIELDKIKARYDRELEGQDDPPNKEEKFKPRELFHRNFYRDIQQSVRTILQRSRFVGADLADFNRQTFDIDIDGYAKEDEQGKGFSAFFNTVLILAFHEYLNQKSRHAPGYLVIDTPLHGFDEGTSTPDTSMRAGLFEHLSEQAKQQQIIILENNDHLEGFTLDEGTNQISFTKKRDEGRYGFLEGVYDVGEGKNE